MLSSLTFKTLVVAALAAGCVWALSIATFVPVAYVDDRPYCSGMINLPDGPSGIGLPEKTFPPRCHNGPTPDEALRPSPVLPVATFLLIGGVGFIVSIRRP